jgi:hypothetical protein
LAQMALFTVSTGCRDQKSVRSGGNGSWRSRNSTRACSSFRVRSSKTATSAWSCSIGLPSQWWMPWNGSNARLHI